MMTSTIQNDVAALTTTANAGQREFTETETKPSAYTSSALEPSTHLAPPAAIIETGKKVIKTPAKQVTGPSKSKENLAIKPVAKKTTPRLPRKPTVKSLAWATPVVASKFKAATPVKAENTVIEPTANPSGVKLLKPKKPKLVRDSFTLPMLDHLLLKVLRKRSGLLGNSAKKSDLIRAGIRTLASMSDADFLKAIKEVSANKNEHPSKD